MLLQPNFRPDRNREKEREEKILINHHGSLGVFGYRLPFQEEKIEKKRKEPANNPPITRRKPAKNQPKPAENPQEFCPAEGSKSVKMGLFVRELLLDQVSAGDCTGYLAGYVREIVRETVREIVREIVRDILQDMYGRLYGRL